MIYFPHLHIYLQHVGRVIQIGSFSVAYYGIIIACAMVAGTILARKEAKRTGQNPDQYLTFAVMAIIISVIGARIYYVAFSWDLYKGHPLDILNLRQGGLAIYGGVIGAIFSAWLFSRLTKIRLGTLVDTACLGLVLGQIIGRWGNFFNREAFGGYTDGLFAMQLPADAVRPGDITLDLMRHMQIIDGVVFIQVHPTFLYESMWNIGVLILLLVFRRHKKFEGEVFFLYLAGYGCGRFWIEGLRTDQLLIPGTHTAVSQVLSLALVILGVCVIVIRRIRIFRAEQRFRRTQMHISSGK